MNEILFREINSWAGQNQWLDWFMIFSAEWLGYLLLIGLALYFYKNRQDYKDKFLLIIGSAVISRLVFTEVIRFIYYSPRPFMVMENVNQLINHETTGSLPSGHASFYFALALGIYFYNKKWGWIYLSSVALIGFARIFAGVHWPLDIIVGAGLGIATTCLVYWLKQKMPRRANIIADS